MSNLDSRVKRLEQTTAEPKPAPIFSPAWIDAADAELETMEDEQAGLVLAAMGEDEQSPLMQAFFASVHRRLESPA